MTDRQPVTVCGHRLDEPGHVCAFFDSSAQGYQLLGPYYAEGLEQGEQVITIVNAEQAEEHRTRLEALGIEVDAAIDDGRLRMCTSENIGARSGNFAADRMCELLRGALSAAQRSGRRVRTSTVMDWATRGHLGSEQLIEYEARVNLLLPVYDCTLLCIYDLNRLNSRAMMDVLATHPHVLHRRQVLPNPYYRPPIELLAELLQPPAPVRRSEARA